MSNKKDLLWPFGRVIAIVAIPIIWIFFIVMLSLTQRYLDWPDKGIRSQSMIVAIIISFIPLVLMLLDYFRRYGASIDIKGVKIDFSRIDLGYEEIKRESFGLPDNIGISGPIISDTSPMDIIRALEEATKSEFVVINLRDGNAWWVTRLLALSTGAVRVGSPHAFIFVGKKENKSGQFLGWSRPNDILEAILNSSEEYNSRYKKSMRISKQVAMYGANELLPQNVVLHTDVTRYTNEWNFTQLGDAVAEQILMDQLGRTFGEASGSLEQPPDRLTIQRLNDLFSHCLYRDSIDLHLSSERQIDQILESQAPYLVLVRNGQYESVLKREDGERLLLKELVIQTQQGVK